MEVAVTALSQCVSLNPIVFRKEQRLRTGTSTRLKGKHLYTEFSHFYHQLHHVHLPLVHNKCRNWHTRIYYYILPVEGRSMSWLKGLSYKGLYTACAAALGRSIETHVFASDTHIPIRYCCGNPITFIHCNPPTRFISPGWIYFTRVN